MEDLIIEKLTPLSNDLPVPKTILETEEILWLYGEAIEVFKSQPNLLEIDGPLMVVGNLHADFANLLRIFEYGGHPSETKYLFLGNYVNRGKQSVQVLCLCLAYKIKYPETFFMLRGNHDCAQMTRIYGGYDEIKRGYGRDWKIIWKGMIDLLNWIPLAAIVNEKIFGVHGGISPELKTLNGINEIPRPDPINDVSLTCDLLWTYPDDGVSEFGYAGGRDVTYIYGSVAVDKFLKLSDFEFIVKAHQIVEDGYEYFANKKLITIFSGSNYAQEFDNIAGIMSIDTNTSYDFITILPIKTNLKTARKYKEDTLQESLSSS